MVHTASGHDSGRLRSGGACAVLFLLCCFCAPLAAQEPAAPDRTLAEARLALSRGLHGAALERSVAALKRAPLAAAENLQMALALFWVGQAEDAARYLRRALADNADILSQEPPLRERLPAADVNDRILAVARKADKNAELCFLTGTMLVLDRDYTRAMPFLVRAEELAGTDGQAGLLLAAIDDSPKPDRNLGRGLRELQQGELDHAVRSFAFTLLDRPALTDAWGGWTLALAAGGQDDAALCMAENMHARCTVGRLFHWLAGGRLTALADAGARFEKLAESARPVPRLRLALVCYYAAGHYASAQRCGVALLLHDKLDHFTSQALDFMSRRALNEDPIGTPAPPTPVLETERPSLPPARSPLEVARAAISRADYATALQVLEPLVGENQKDNMVFHLLFVSLAGRGELIEAGSAFQVWFLRADEAERTRINAVRSLFARGADYDRWLKRLTDAREADMAAALPRMLIAYAEICDGKYESARVNLSIALRAEGKNGTLQAMSKMLDQSKYASDVGRPKVPDAPDAVQLMLAGEKLFREKKYADALASYLAAMEADPKLRGVSAALLRGLFAVGEYDRAADHLLRFLDDLDVANKGAQTFMISVGAGYADQSEFTGHLEALKTVCDKRQLAAGPWLLYGAILYGKRDYNGAADALRVWRENVRGEPHKGALLIYEAARKLAR